MPTIELLPENGQLSENDKEVLECILTEYECTIAYKYLSKYKVELKFSKFSKQGDYFLPTRGRVGYKKYKFKSKGKVWDDANSKTKFIYIKNLLIQDTIIVNFPEKFDKAMSNHINEPTYFNNPITITYEE
ncbi:MAG: hypothetical protein CMC93_03020 [Flavobacteriaceae bacterium]|nr:hypothetical protein [Flavobacteriaceae bacterium]